MHDNGRLSIAPPVEERAYNECTLLTIAQLNDDVEHTAAIADSPPFKPVVYGSIVSVASSSRNNSTEVSPVELPRPGYTLPHQHRIIPPSISGHGRLILAHRTVPYWVGVLFVTGAFAWAVWCAIYVYRVLGGDPRGYRYDDGQGS